MTLYDTIGVSPTATQKEITAAYRKKAMKQHPDKGGDKTEFQALTLAYSVLNDPERRRRYDTTGDTHSEKSEQENQFRKLLVEGFMRSDKPIQAILKKLDGDIQEQEVERAKIQTMRNKLENRLKAFLKLNTSEIVKETIEAQILSIDQLLTQNRAMLDLLTRLKNDFKDFKEESEKSELLRTEDELKRFIYTHFK